MFFIYLFIYLRRYNEETKFPVTPSFVLTLILSDECVSGVPGNFVSSLYLLIQSSTL